MLVYVRIIVLVEFSSGVGCEVCLENFVWVVVF